MTAITRDFPIAHDDHGPDSKTPLGFWIYLMSDCVLFASIFAGFVVLRDNLNGGPAGRDLFDLTFVAVETSLLLVSSLTYGLAMIAANKGNLRTVYVWLGLTFLCGLGFVSMEVHEFSKLIAEGAGPDRSAFLSGFFTLVGTHGLHVTSGLLWMAVMFVQLATRGLTAVNRTRLLLLSLFWHFLDIVWIGVFSIVYLMGAA
jgi:cytochrome o ubiquinol oxidase subunit III